MSETTQAVIERITDKEGATNGRAWRKFTVKTEDGTFYSTFDKTLAEKVHGLIGKRATITFTTSGDENQFRDILSAEPVEGSAAVTNGHGGDASPLPTSRTSGGTADWDVIGLRKTRCLLWAEYLQSPMAAAIAAGAGDKPPANRVYDFGAALIALAEYDIYWRDPADESEPVPF